MQILMTVMRKLENTGAEGYSGQNRWPGFRRLREQNPENWRKNKLFNFIKQYNTIYWLIKIFYFLINKSKRRYHEFCLNGN